MSPVIADGGSVRIGVDLGGTSSRLVAIDRGGGVVAHQLVDTRSFANQGATGVADRLIDRIEAICDGRPALGVGIGASGPIDAAGLIHNPDTLPEFIGIDLPSEVTSRLGVPCLIDSDAVVFALGEFHLGAARDVATMIGVTLGTGVGACAVTDGRPHRGGDGLHPEGGHIPTPGPPAPCYCGLEYCWEQRASRTALEQIIAERFDGRDLEWLAAAGVSGNRDALATLREYGVAVGDGLAALATLFRPQTIVIGGGSAAYLDLFIDGIRLALSRNGQYRITAKVLPSELGVLAGAIGAATLVKAADHSYQSTE